ncbi:nitrate transporter [Umbelopsis sp. PMI_123]|nr:nitrate transporter [Umbelopsis sp. PMI_123]
MFSPNVVGAANALAGGWGNMGGGITYLIIPPIYNGIYSHIPNSTAWRVVYIIPAGMCILVSLIDIFFSDDCPEGKWHSARQPQNVQGASQVNNTKEDIEKVPQVTEYEDVDNTDVDSSSLSSVNSHKGLVTSIMVFFKTLVRPSVLILIVQYASSFGLELSVDNIIAALFHSRFQLSLTASSYVGSVFGLMNLFSRLSGGLLADYLYRKWRIPGRLLVQIIILTLEGVFLIGFSYSLGRLDASIVMMVMFSFFVQATCGSTFSLAPFIDPANSGTVMGIIGAGGSLGGLCFNFLFKSYGTDYHTAFLILGIIALVASIPGTLLLRVQGHMLYNMKSIK